MGSALGVADHVLTKVASREKRSATPISNFRFGPLFQRLQTFFDLVEPIDEHDQILEQIARHLFGAYLFLRPQRPEFIW